MMIICPLVSRAKIRVALPMKTRSVTVAAKLDAALGRTADADFLGAHQQRGAGR